ncbi:hypothetical protein C1752_03331 [Acaryochloris thomasi RCC1774]|uniref:Uncharacterized protein n=1 Tax=Acaryochloris thomasi RCC1774 TaxID=1764569 RepID=A0A2W1JH44_9CYAN|nr:hypothetical protein [Acaryochloris thomasi]PZD72900.1 hypothetical protein C1752_03331 [Acaryochloris thomasi RCC1774]
MIPQEFVGFIPSLQPVAQTIENHQLTYTFTWEVQRRQEHQQHCQWYAKVAEQNRRELEQMKGDIDILSWIRRDRR